VHEQIAVGFKPADPATLCLQSGRRLHAIESALLRGSVVIRLPTVSGGPGQGQGGGDPLGRGYLVQRTNEGPEQHGRRYRPPRYGCGCSASAMLVLAIALLSRLA
jgi:hypothetical protein